MAMKRMLDKNVPVHDGRSHRRSERYSITNIGDGVRDHLRPVLAKSSKPISELRPGLVCSVHIVMSFFERLLCLFVERHWSKISSYDQRYNVRVIAL